MSSKRRYSVHKSSDEMSEIRTLSLTIPQYGGVAIDEAFATFSGAQRKEALDDIKREFGYEDFLNDPERKGRDVSGTDWLSPEGYRHLICCRIEDLERLTSAEAGHSEITAIVNKSIAFGRLVEHARLRQQQLSNVKRGAKVRSGAKLGGEMLKGRRAAETQAIVAFMHGWCQEGESISTAARKAQRKYPGKQLGSYRKLYHRYRPK